MKRKNRRQRGRAGGRAKRPKNASPRRPARGRRHATRQPKGRCGLVIQLLCQHADGQRVRLHRQRVGRIYQRDGTGAAAIWREVDHAKLAELAAGFAHPQRVLLVRTLMSGATRYRELRVALGAKAGPLYHHVRQLRLCGLLQMGRRDVYRLTDKGHLAAGVLCGLERLLSRQG